MPVSIILAKFKNNFDQVFKKIKILLCIVVVVFLSRNYIRINDEYNKYNYSPLINSFYKVDERHFRIEKIFSELIDNFENCEKSLNNCNYEKSLRVKKIFKNRYIFVVKND